MTSISKLTLCGAVVALVMLLPGCSKEGGYPPPDKVVASDCVTMTELKIANWGPQGTKAGVPFNTQSDGSAAIWVQMNQTLVGSDATIELNGKALTSAISDKLITANVPAEFYAKPGTYVLHVTMKKGDASTHSNDVQFVVK